MRVIEFGDGFGFALEEADGFLAGLNVRIGTGLGADDFEGHLLLNARILGQVHLPHASAAQQAKDAIAVNLLSFQGHVPPRQSPR
jgi:hypothetical protein